MIIVGNVSLVVVEVACSKKRVDGTPQKMPTPGGKQTIHKMLDGTLALPLTWTWMMVHKVMKGNFLDTGTQLVMEVAMQTMMKHTAPLVTSLVEGPIPVQWEWQP